MLKKRNAQGLSITMIVAAVIALVIIVVIIAILTRNLGSFSSGAGTAISCRSVCEGFRMKVGFEHNKNDCKVADNEKYIPGTFDELPVDTLGTRSVCCCQKP